MAFDAALHPAVERPDVEVHFIHLENLRKEGILIEDDRGLADAAFFEKAAKGLIQFLFRKVPGDHPAGQRTVLVGNHQRCLQAGQTRFAALRAGGQAAVGGIGRHGFKRKQETARAGSLFFRAQKEIRQAEAVHTAIDPGIVNLLTQIPPHIVRRTTFASGIEEPAKDKMTEQRIPARSQAEAVEDGTEKEFGAGQFDAPLLERGGVIAKLRLVHLVEKGFRFPGLLPHEFTGPVLEQVGFRRRFGCAKRTDHLIAAAALVHDADADAT